MKISNERARRWIAWVVGTLIVLGVIALFVLVLFWASGHAGS